MNTLSLLPAALSTTVLAQAPVPQAQDIECATQARQVAIGESRQARVRCPNDCETQLAVWGTKVYTDDSSVCVAALHAGELTSEGGEVTFHLSPGRERYLASEQNGVSSRAWGRWSVSFEFGPQPDTSQEEEIDCRTTVLNLGHLGRDVGDRIRVRCPADCAFSTVWGSAMYTSDSSICTAAVHAGALDNQGGSTEVLVAPGQSSYAGSTQNGVTTRDWGAWSLSFLFDTSTIPPDTTFSDCKTGTQSFSGQPGEQYWVFCPEGCTEGPPLWGTSVYTDDSPVCRAAIHAGVLEDRGGLVRVELEPYAEDLPGSLQNGVESRPWGAWYRNYSFVVR